MHEPQSQRLCGEGVVMFGLVMKAWVADGLLNVEAWEPVLRKREGSLALSFTKDRFRLRASDGFDELIDTAQFLVGWLRLDPTVAEQITKHRGESNARSSQRLPDRRESDFPVP